MTACMSNFQATVAKWLRLVISIPEEDQHSNGVSASTPSEKATLFNNYFFSVFIQPRVCAGLPTVLLT